MTTRSLQKSMRILAIGCLAIGFHTASAVQCKAQLIGTIEAKEIGFVNGKPGVAEGTGTIKNERGETVASGTLLINDGTLALAGKNGAVFTYEVRPTTPSPTNWPTKAPTNVALVVFDGKDKWTLKDDQFWFMLELDDQFNANVLIDISLLSSSSISLPEGTYFMWQYSITAGAGGGTVVFRQGHPVDGSNTTIETPEKKKLQFPRKGNGGADNGAAVIQKTFKIISITREKEFGGPFRLKTGDGYVFIAVAFVPVPLSTVYDYPDYRDAFLVDSLGEKHGASSFELVGVKTINGKTMPEYVVFAFPMKETAKPKEMLVKDLRADLTKTREQLPKPHATKSTK